MREMGFEIDPSTAGSSVRFDPPNPKDRSITFHKRKPGPLRFPLATLTHALHDQRTPTPPCRHGRSESSAGGSRTVTDGSRMISLSEPAVRTKSFLERPCYMCVTVLRCFFFYWKTYA